MDIRVYGVYTGAMDKALASCLLQLGCNEKHVRFYRANLELGTAPLRDITKKARLQRSTAYLIAAEMVAMGLASENHKTYKKSLTAAEPDTLLQKIEAKHRRIGRSTLSFKKALPELRAAHRTTMTRPRVRTFEGQASLTSVWKDILSEPQEILLWTNQQTESHVFSADTHQQFIKERLAKRIPIRVLAVHNKEGEALVADDGTCMRQTKLLPPAIHFTAETYIYGDKVTVLDIGKDIFGVVTENKQIAASQRAIFELAWTTGARTR